MPNSENKEEIYDIDKTKDLFIDFKDILIVLEEKSQDGDLKISEIITTFPKLVGIYQDLQNIKEIGQELGDLSETETNELAPVAISCVFLLLKIIGNLQDLEEN